MACGAPVRWSKYTTKTLFIIKIQTQIRQPQKQKITDENKALKRETS